MKISTMPDLIGMIADHPTPKIYQGDGVAYTLNCRDYKGAMIIVLSTDNRITNGKHAPRQFLRARCL